MKNSTRSPTVDQWLVAYGTMGDAAAPRAISRSVWQSRSRRLCISLCDYVIAAAISVVTLPTILRDRASHRGIRLASDMVPNHMGIDSRWVVEHPDWFSRGAAFAVSVVPI